MRSTMMRAIPAAAVLCAAGASASAATVFAVTNDQTLISFDSSTPGSIMSGVAISGLQSNEQIRGIDFRPANGQLYALGSFNRLYTIDTMSGAATMVGAGPFANALNGSSFGFDFNPVIDRIRVVSDADQNIVLNPNDGTSTLVTPLFYGPGDANEGANPNVVASAYTNSVSGAKSTQLYGLDTGLDILVTQANSAGTLGTVGSLGADLTDLAGFDITPNGSAFAMVQDTTLGQSTFWTIDLMTGQASMVGEVGGGALVTAMAIVPAPGGLAVLSAAGVLAARRRR